MHAKSLSDCANKCLMDAESLPRFGSNRKKFHCASVISVQYAIYWFLLAAAKLQR